MAEMGVRLAAATAVVVVLLAGCVGTSGVGEPSTATTTTEAPSKPYDVPLNGTEVLETHVRGLEAAGSFTYEKNTSLWTGGDRGAGQLTTNRTAAVDLATGRALARWNGTFYVETRRYRTADGRVYERVAGRPAKPAEPNGKTDAGRLLRPGVEELLGNVTLSDRGSTVRDGERRFVYGAGGVDAVTWNRTGIDPANVSAFDLRLVVDDDGVVRSLRVRIVLRRDGARQTVVQTTRYRDVGSTTVERPDWAGEPTDGEN